MSTQAPNTHNQSPPGVADRPNPPTKRRGDGGSKQRQSTRRTSPHQSPIIRKRAGLRWRHGLAAQRHRRPSVSTKHTHTCDSLRCASCTRRGEQEGGKPARQTKPGHQRITKEDKHAPAVLKLRQGSRAHRLGCPGWLPEPAVSKKVRSIPRKSYFRQPLRRGTKESNMNNSRMRARRPMVSLSLR